MVDDGQRRVADGGRPRLGVESRALDLQQAVDLGVGEGGAVERGAGMEPVVDVGIGVDPADLETDVHDEVALRALGEVIGAGSRFELQVDAELLHVRLDAGGVTGALDGRVDGDRLVGANPDAGGVHEGDRVGDVLVLLLAPARHLEELLLREGLGHEVLGHGAHEHATARTEGVGRDLAVDDQVHGLAHTWVVERWLLRVHVRLRDSGVQLAVHVDAVAHLSLEGLGLGQAQAGRETDQVDLARDEGAFVGLARERDELDPVEVGQLLAVLAHLEVVRIAVDLGVDAGVERVADEGAGAELILVELHALVADGFPLLTVDHEDGVVGEEAEHRGEGFLRRDAEGEVVDHIDAVDLVELTLDELGVVLVEAVDAEGRILGGELPAVCGGQIVPVDVGIQLEDVGEVVGLLGERLGQLGVHPARPVVVQDAVEGPPHRDRVRGRVVRDCGVVHLVAGNGAGQRQDPTPRDIGANGRGRSGGLGGSLGRLGGSLGRVCCGLGRLGGGLGRPGGCRCRGGRLVVIVVAAADQQSRGGPTPCEGSSRQERPAGQGTPAHVPGPVVLGHIASLSVGPPRAVTGILWHRAMRVTRSGAPDGRPALVRC